MTLNNGPKNTKNNENLSEVERVRQILKNSPASKELEKETGVFLSSDRIKNLLDKLITKKTYTKTITPETTTPLKYILNILEILKAEGARFHLNQDVLEKIVSRFETITESKITSDLLLSLLNSINKEIVTVPRDLAHPSVVAKMIGMCSDIDSPDKLKKFLLELAGLNEFFSKSKTTAFILVEILEKNIESNNHSKIENAIKMCEELIKSDQELENKAKQIDIFKITLLVSYILVKNAEKAMKIGNDFLKKFNDRDANITENINIVKSFLTTMVLGAQSMPEIEFFRIVLDAFYFGKSQLIVDKINEIESESFLERTARTTKKASFAPITKEIFLEEIYRDARQFYIKQNKIERDSGPRIRTSPFWRVQTSEPIDEMANRNTNYALEQKLKSPKPSK